MSFEILTIDEAAGRARVSRRQMNRCLADGHGPALTLIRGSKRIRSDLLEEWLQRCTTNSAGSTNSQAVAA